MATGDRHLGQNVYVTNLDEVSITTGDVEIGAVELKNASTDDRASIAAANTARTTGTMVLAVQNVDAAGAVLSTSALATSAKQDTGNTSLASLDTNLAKTIPATTAEAVTPSDATALTSRAVWVGGVGDLSVRLSGAASTTVVFTAVPAGTLLPISVVRVMAATTATNINVLN